MAPRSGRRRVGSPARWTSRSRRRGDSRPRPLPRPSPARSPPPSTRARSSGRARRPRSLPRETVVLVSHAIVTRLIVLAALGLGPDRLWSVDASPAGITEIEYLDAWATVHCMNTLAHLDGLREDGA